MLILVRNEVVFLTNFLREKQIYASFKTWILHNTLLNLILISKKETNDC